MEEPQMTAAGQFNPHDFANAGTIAKWLDGVPDEQKLPTAQEAFTALLKDAAQPVKSSSQACVKLCGFVQLCTKSKHAGIRQWAFEERTSMRLFDFYIERNEHDQHRSMRLVLDVLMTTFLRNPNPEVGMRIKTAIMDTLLRIISKQTTRPLVKSSLHCVVHFLSKQAITLDEVAATYRKVNPYVRAFPTLHLWRSLVGVMFTWMDMHYVTPIAGKFVVNIFTGLQSLAQTGTHPDLDGFGVEIWQLWLQDALAANMARLESVKNYIITPLFTIDRRSALELLEIYIEENITQALDSKWASLRLSILEIGKKVGMVDEPGTIELTADQSPTITLQSSVLESFLVHPSHLTRSSGLSLLVSSSATTKPLSDETLRLVQSHLAAYYADADAKFRNDILSLTKDLVHRVKYVMNMASRSLVKAEAKAQHMPADDQPSKEKKQKTKRSTENLITDPRVARAVLDRHAAFLKWYIEFLKRELIPTASYQRHITALKAILPVLKLGKHASGSDESLDMDTARSMFTDPTCVRLLLDLLLDPFDDVRETAMGVLLMVPQEFMIQPMDDAAGSTTLVDALAEFCSRAVELADRTGRADHGNGAARAQGLLCSWLGTKQSRIGLIQDKIAQLEAKLVKARQDLGRSAMENSLHGDYAALGYMLQVLIKVDTYQAEGDRSLIGEIYQRIVNCSVEAWDIVKHVLCDDSPEGHLPEEMEDLEGLDTKDLLSYSFRAIHESSNVMRMIASGVGNWSIESALIPAKDVFDTIGDLTFDQLAMLRHRGAFTTVSSTFTTCCQMVPQAPKSYQSDHLRRWYEQAKHYIETLASTTRRSAGIPSLIIGVLAANTSSPSFDEVFHELGDIAKRPALAKNTDGSDLPQVHALNCLRGIFRTSLLSKRAESYLPATLELAATCLKSEIWAIRNCGLLLLRSLIDCLFGTGESKHVTEAGWDGHTIRISYNKYPTLPGVLVGLLKSAAPSDLTPGLSSTGAAEAVFPVLDIIRRAGPPDEYRDELFGYIKGYLGSRLWHVREIAARTLCSFLLSGDWVDTIRELIYEPLRRQDYNGLHGALMTAKFVLERKLEIIPEPNKENGEDAEILYDDYLGDFHDALSHLHAALYTNVGGPPLCEECLAAFYEIQTTLLKRGYQGFSDCISWVLKDDLSALENSDDEDINWAIEMDGIFTEEEDEAGTQSALLQLQRSLMTVYSSANRNTNASIALLIRRVQDYGLKGDTDTARKILEVIPEVWGPIVERHGVKRRIMYAFMCDIAGDTGSVVHVQHGSPQIRALALGFIQKMLGTDLRLYRKGCGSLDFAWSRTMELWKNLQAAVLNPGLSQVILSTSGSIMALSTLQARFGWGDSLMAWGNMVADALDVDNTFDTRFAAAKALESYFKSAGHLAKHPEHLPALLALYDALNDDDDEVRDVATQVAGIVTGETVTTIEAADRLLDWMTPHFRDEEEFRAAVVRRLAGMSNKHVGWPSAETLLTQALDFDDSLFAEEEQNLFVDEIRESERFLRVFRKLRLGEQEEVYRRFASWTAEALETLVRLAGEKEDGPLGWTADQHVFAVCAGIILSAVALRQKDAGYGALLDRLVEVSKKSRLHGSLLAMVQQGH